MLVIFADALAGRRRAELARSEFVLQQLAIDHVEKPAKQQPSSIGLSHAARLILHTQQNYSSEGVERREKN
jgi:hypothetical protein